MSSGEMQAHGPWQTDDFEAMSWHDVHVHGFWLDAVDTEKGSADLHLDIDFILKWEQAETGFVFTVCPAHLHFHEVFGMKLVLDYAAVSAGMCPFSLAGIEREIVESLLGYRSYHWRLPFNWPTGSLEFDAPGFTQSLTGTPQVQTHQWLDSGKRQGVKRT